MTGQTTAFCDHVYNARGPSIRPEKSVSFLYAQGFITGDYGISLYCPNTHKQVFSSHRRTERF